ncbi:invasin domain 3-containing protein [Neisseria sp. Ec49-e6-T10]|uniref:invasin domain 3-containing protein n=1 Tax=Neisseria sp. Ec49-e6-T10 TaxID=3140744 RepID=UPI003EBD555E
MQNKFFYKRLLMALLKSARQGLKGLSAALLVSIMILSAAHTWALEFNCNTVYSGNASNLYRAVVHEPGQSASFPFSLVGATTGADSTTTGLGYIDGIDVATGIPKGPLTMSMWSYAYGNSFYTTESNASATTMVRVPGSGNLDPSPRTDWPGGAVYPKTGELYQVGGLNTNMNTNTYFRVVNPKTGVVVEVGRPTLVGGGALPQTTLMSDMAIDAEGAAYVILRGSGSGNHVLVKVDRSKGWQYSKMLTITGLGARDVHGMAFLNGTLYVSTGDVILWSIDVFTGQTTRIGTLPSTSSFDLASCQTAPVIKGTVFHDVNGQGNPSAQGVEGVTVEIYKDEAGVVTLKGETTTDADGSYSFITNEPTATYYIRLKRPQIAGVNAAQTWANAGNDGYNTITSYCTDGQRDAIETNVSGVCRGARVGTDGDSSGSVGTDLLGQGQTFSKVVTTTDLAVPEVNFAITTATDYGDAPSAFGTLKGAGPAHVDIAKLLYMGAEVSTEPDGQPSTQADLDTYDDGVQVNINGTYVNLQDVVLTVGRKYTFKVQTNGDAHARGYLNAWVSWNNSGPQMSFVQQIATNLNSNTGEITFDYTVPSGSASQPISSAYFRFRFSSEQNLTATGAGSYWVNDGEVEDYRVQVVTGQLLLSAKSIGGVNTFNQILTNISGVSPSATTQQLVTTADNTVVSQDPQIPHAFASMGTPVTISTTLATGWSVSEVSCVNLAAADPTTKLTTTITNNVVSIDPVHITEGAEISCELTYTNGALLKLIKSVASRAHGDDQFTVQIKDEQATVLESAVTTGTGTTAQTQSYTASVGKIYTFDEEMVAGSKTALNRYNSAITCINNNASSSTVLPSGAGQSFTITPSYGDDVTCTLTNTAIPADPTKSEIKADPVTITADGLSTSTITVQLKDASGNNLTTGGDTVLLNISSDTGTPAGTLGTVADNGDGTYTATLTSPTKVGVDSIAYTVNTIAGSGTAKVSYLAGMVDVSKSTIQIDKNIITANNTDTALVTISLFDAHDNPVSGETVTSSLSNNLGNLSNISDKGDGTYTATLTSTKAGTEVISYSVDGVGAPGTQSITYQAGSIDFDKSKIETDKTEIIVNTLESATVTVTLVDAYDNPIIGKTVTLSLSNGLGAMSLVSDHGDGTYTAGINADFLGSDIVSYTVDGVTGKDTVTINYIAGPVDISKSKIEIDKPSIVADGSEIATVKVSLFDAYDNPVSGETVTLSLSNSLGNLSNITDKGDGTYTATLTSIKAGSDEISYFVSGTSAPGTVNITYTAGDVDLTHTNTNIDVTPSSIVADGTTEATVTITLSDANGNPVSGEAAKLAISLSGSLGTLGNITEAGNGVYTAKLTSTTAGSETVGFSYDGTVATGKTAPITYTAGDVDLGHGNTTLNVSPSSIVADGTTEATVTITLSDANGNPVSGEASKLAISLSGSLGSLSSITDVGNGVYTAKLTSTTAGSETVGFSYDGTVATGKTAPITYTAGDVDLGHGNTTLNVSPSSIVADGTTEATVTITLSDANGNPVSGEASKLAISLSGSLGSLSSITDVGNGVYTAKLTSTTAGSETVGFSYDGTVATGKTAPITYTAGDVDLGHASTSIAVNPSSIVADGTTEATVTITLSDANGNPVSGEASKLVISLSGSLGTLGNITDVGNGVYTAKLTSTTAGSETVGFSYDGTVATGKTAPITYTAGDVDLGHGNTTINVSPSSIVADGTTEATVTITLSDANGNPVSGEASKLAISLSGSLGSLSSITDVGNGVYTAKLTSTTAGSETVGFSYDGTVATGKTAPITYTAGDVDLGHGNTTLNVSPSSIVADGTTEATVTITLSDANGNPVSGEAAKLAISLSGSLGTLGNITEAGNGVYTAKLTSTTAGSETVGFSYDGTVATGKTAPITYTAGDVDLGHASTSIAVNPSSIVADGTTEATVTITLSDANGNPVSGEASKLAISLSGSLGSLSSITDVGNGVYTAKLTSTTAGSETVGFSYDGTVATGKTAPITYTAGDVDLGHGNTTLNVSPSSIVADGTTEATVTITLSDANGNPVSGEAAKLAISLSGSLGTLGNITEAGNGVYTAKLTSTTAGSETVGFSYDGTVATGKTASITYTAGDVDLGHASTSIAVNPSSIVADGTTEATVTITLSDANGNPVSGEAAKLAISLSGSLGSLSSITDVGNGVYTAKLTSTTAGSETVGFSYDGTVATGKTAPITYTAGDVDLGHASTSIAVNPSSIVADGTTEATVTITLSDANGNPVSGEAAKLAISLSGSLGTLGNITDVGNGVYTAKLTSTTAGSETVGFSYDGTVATGKTAPITYTAGDVDLGHGNTTLNVSPSSIVADGTTEATVTITLSDAHGNPVSGEAAKLAISLSGSLGSLSSITDVGNGVYTAKLTSTTAGSETVGFSYDGTVATGKTAPITYTAGDVDLGHASTSIAVNPSSIVADGTTEATVTITLSDANGNPVSGEAAKLAISLSGSLGTLGNITDVGNGVYTAKLTSTTAGSETVGFSYDGTVATGKTAPITYTAGDVDLGNSNTTLNVSPSSIVADGTTEATVTITLSDANGNPVSGEASKLAISLSGSLGSLSSITDVGNGVYTAKLTSTTAGSETVGFSYDGTVATGKTAPITYTAGDVDLGNSNTTLNVSPSSIVADGTTEATVTITLSDANGNPVSGEASKLAISLSGSLGSLSSITDVGNGVYTAKLTSTTAGSETVGFSYDGTVATGKTAPITYTAGDVDLGHAGTTISVSPNNIAADGTTEATVTITLSDANGNPVSGEASKLAISLSNSLGDIQGIISESTVGVYTVKLTSTKAGSEVIGFSYDNTVATGKTANITYMVGPVDFTKTKIEASKLSITADGIEFSEIKVSLFDAYNNPISGETVTLSLSNSLGSIGSITDGGNGTYTAKLTSIKAGNDNVGYAVGGTAGSQTVNVGYVAGDVDLGHGNTTLNVSPSSIVADGTTEATVTITLSDANGNPVSGEAAKLAISLSGSLGTLGNITEAGNGVYTAKLTSTTAGSETVGFSYDGTVATGKTAPITYTAGDVDLGHGNTTLNVSPSSIVADGTTEATVTITLSDANGNPVSGEAAKLAISLSGSLGTLGNITEAGNGVYTAKLTSTTAGSETVGFSYDGTVATGKTAPITYTAGDVDLGHGNTTLNVSPSSIVADGTTEATVTITLSDANGNPVSGEASKLAISLSGSLGSLSSITDVGNGVYTAKLTSTTAGSETVGFSYDGTVATGKTAPITYTAGDVDLGHGNTTINVSPSSIVADGTTEATVTITLSDANGNPVSGEASKLAISLSNSLGDIQGIISESTVGVYTVKLTSTTAGSETVGFSYDGTVATGKTAPITYTAGDVDLGHASTSIAVNPSSIVADGTTEATVTITLSDANGNPVSGEASKLVISLSGSLGTLGNITDVGNGVYTAKLTSTTAGSETVGFSYDGTVATGKTAPITYTAGDVDLGHGNTTINVSPSSIVADGTTEATVTITLSDANGNPVSGEAAKLAISLSGSLGSLSSITDVGNGVYTAKLTSTTAGSETVGFSYDGTVATGKTAPITYTAGDVDLGHASTSIAVNPSSIVADGTTEATVTITLSDANGNPVSGEASKLAISLSGSLGSLSSITDVGNGVYTAKLTSTIAGSETVGFSYDGTVATGKTAPITYTAGDVDLGHGNTTLNVSPSSIVADGTTEATVTITLSDANGNPVSGEASKLAISLSGSLGSLSSITDVGNGVYTAKLTSTTAGSETVGFSYDGTVATGKTAPITYTAGDVDLGHGNTTINVSPSSIVADGTTEATVTITLSDANGNPVSGEASKLAISLSGSLGSLSSITDVGNGVYTAKLTSTTAGSETVGFSYDGTVATGKTASITYTAGDVDLGHASTSIAVNPSSIVADGTTEATVTITLSDAHGNPVSGEAAKLAISLSGGLGSLSSITDVGNGVYTAKLTSTTAGSETVGFSYDGTVATGKTAPITYTAGDVDLGHGNTTLNVSPSSIVADGTTEATVTITLSDAHGNPVSGEASKLAISLSGSLGSLSSITDVGNGVYTAKLTSTTAGSETVGFSYDGTVATGKTAPITYTAGDVDLGHGNTTLNVSPSSIVADGTTEATVTITLSDANGNPVSGEASKLAISLSGSLGSLSSITDVGNGVYTAKLTSTTAGSETVGFSYDGTVATGKTAPITYTAGDVDLGHASTSIAVNPSSIVADGTTEATVTITLSDANGNPVSGEASKLAISLSGSLGSLSSITDVGNGVYTAKLTSTIAGSETVGFSYDGTVATGKTAPITYTAGDVDLGHGNTTLNVSPSSIVADGTTEATVTITLSDANGNPVSGEASKLAISLSGSLGSLSSITDVGNGVYTAKLTSTTAGSETVGFSYDGTVATGKTAPITYTAGDVDLGHGNTTLNVSPSSIVADGSTEATVTITLSDANGNPVSGEASKLAISLSGGLGSLSSITDVGNGVYTAKLTSTTAGSETVGFSYDGTVATGKTASITYTAGDVDLGHASTSIAVNPSSIVADGTTEATVTITLSDANGNPISGEAAKLAISLSGGLGSLSSITDVGNGVYTAKLTSTAAGSETVGFSYNGTVATGKTDTVTYTAGAPDANSSVISANPISITADGTSTSTITVQLKDTHGNNLTTGGANVTMTVDSGTLSSVVDNGNGTYTATLTSSTTVGTGTVGFTVSGVTSSNKAIVTYTVGAPDANSSVISANPTSITADGVSTSIITVQLKDIAGNNLTTSGGIVTMLVDSGTLSSVVDNGDGTYTATLTSPTTVGVGTVSFALEGITSANTAIVNYVVGAANASESVISASPTSITADGVSTSIITLQLRDSVGNDLTTGGDTVAMNVVTMSRSATAVLSAVTDNGDGTYTATLTAPTIVGSADVSYTINSADGKNKASVAFTAGAASTQYTSIISAQDTLEADGVSTTVITVQLKDAFGNIITTGGENITMSLNGTGALSSVVDNGDGTYTAVLTAPTAEGSGTISYAINGVVGTQTVTVQYVSDASLRIVLTASVKEAKIGDLIRYTATVTNTGTSTAKDFSVLNTLPAGLSYVDGSATTSSSDALGIIGNSPLNLSGLNLAPGTELKLTYILRVGAGVRPGTFTTVAEAYSHTNKSLSNRASADVVITNKDPMLDDSLILGTVYYDINANGMQDEGEPGIPGVRIASVEGLIIETDQYGRYHLEDVLGGSWDRGRNFILKVDPSSLPKDSTFTTENPLVRRITPGIPVRFDFGVKLPNDLINGQKPLVLELSDKIFESGKATIVAENEQSIEQMAKLIHENKIKAIVIETKVGESLAQKRIELLRKQLMKLLGETEGLSLIILNIEPTTGQSNNVDFDKSVFQISDQVESK